MTTIVLNTLAQWTQAVEVARLYFHHERKTFQALNSYLMVPTIIESAPCNCYRMFYEQNDKSYRTYCPFRYSYTHGGGTQTILMCHDHMELYQKIRSQQALSNIEGSLSTIALATKHIVGEIDRASVVRVMDGIRDEVKELRS